MNLRTFYRKLISAIVEINKGWLIEDDRGVTLGKAQPGGCVLC